MSTSHFLSLLITKIMITSITRDLLAIYKNAFSPLYNFLTLFRFVDYFIPRHQLRKMFKQSRRILLLLRFEAMLDRER